MVNYFLYLVGLEFISTFSSKAHLFMLWLGKVVQKMELFVLSRLDWNMSIITPFSFLSYFIKDVNFFVQARVSQMYVFLWVRGAKLVNCLLFICQIQSIQIIEAITIYRCNSNLFKSSCYLGLFLCIRGMHNSFLWCYSVILLCLFFHAGLIAKDDMTHIWCMCSIHDDKW